jgi:starvation-inducible outer membrane lipoprotein
MRRGVSLLVPAVAMMLAACAEPPRVPAAKTGVTAVELT